MSTPALGGGPLNPAAVGDAIDDMLIMLLRGSNVALWGTGPKAGEASGCLNMDAEGEARGFW
jgi:hypothetical protein